MVAVPIAAGQVCNDISTILGLGLVFFDVTLTFSQPAVKTQ
jgi:hypothetical protein